MPGIGCITISSMCFSRRRRSFSWSERNPLHCISADLACAPVVRIGGARISVPGQAPHNRCLKDQIMNELEQVVVIVGAGPTGLALGAELKRLGISSLI